MSSFLARALSKLRQPLPDIGRLFGDRIRACIWRRHLQRAGKNLKIGPGAMLQGTSCICIGDGFFAGPMLWIEAVREYRGFRYQPLIEIGDNVTCSQRVHIAATRRVTVHDGVLFGSGVHVTDHGHGTYGGDVQDSPDVPPALRAPSQGRPVLIERNVWLGDNVVVLPGVTIGEGSIVGANSVVARDLPPRVIAVGAPAVPIKAYDQTRACWIAIETHP